MRRLMIGATLAIAAHIPTLIAQPGAERSRAMTQYKLGFESMRAEQWAAAAKAFQSAIDIDETFDLAYYMLGRVRMNQKQYADAVASFSKARDLYTQSAGRQFANAQEVQRYRREQMIAIDETLRSLRQGPQTMQTQDQIRQLEERKRQLQENIQQGNNISIDASVPSFVSLSLGSAYYRTGNRAEAEKYYKEAIAMDTKAAEAHNNLAVVYLETGRPVDAEREITAAERAGFKVHPQLKADVQAAKKKTIQ